MNITPELNDALNRIYAIDPKWCYQLRALANDATDEREIWKRIDDAKGSRNPTRIQAHNAVAAVAAKAIADFAR